MNLENLNVTELSAQQIQETGGGRWDKLIAFGLYVASEWDDISDGFNDSMQGNGYNYTR
jgi:hypothetical protein